MLLLTKWRLLQQMQKVLELEKRSKTGELQISVSVRAPMVLKHGKELQQLPIDCLFLYIHKFYVPTFINLTLYVLVLGTK